MKYQFNKIFPLFIEKKMLENLISVPVWVVSALLDVRYCPKLQSYAISKKTNDANLRKSQKKPLILSPILTHLAQTWSP